MLRSGCSNEPSFLGVNAVKLELECVLYVHVCVKRKKGGGGGVVHARIYTQLKHTGPTEFFHIMSTVCVSSGARQSLCFSPRRLGKVTKTMLMDEMPEKILNATKGTFPKWVSTGMIFFVHQLSVQEDFRR